jgi:hypothetical protein
MGILIFKGLTARRLNMSFGVKGLKTVGFVMYESLNLEIFLNVFLGNVG